MCIAIYGDKLPNSVFCRFSDDQFSYTYVIFFIYDYLWCLWIRCFSGKFWDFCSNRSIIICDISYVMGQSRLKSEWAQIFWKLPIFQIWYMEIPGNFLEKITDVEFFTIIHMYLKDDRFLYVHCDFPSNICNISMRNSVYWNSWKIPGIHTSIWYLLIFLVSV